MALGPAGPAAVGDTWQTMHSSVAAYSPDIDLDGVLVEAMASPASN